MAKKGTLYFIKYPSPNFNIILFFTSQMINIKYKGSKRKALLIVLLQSSTLPTMHYTIHILGIEKISLEPKQLQRSPDTTQ